ncbi:MAG: M48 family metallopeptidase, partial [Clostridia bacterium]|nr:M48 family metallopeptidase [Clostridia bacterium]
LKRDSKEKMTAFVDEISSRYGFEYSRIRISSARPRWGSCSKNGVLSFTCFLAFVPPELAFYVAVHELSHTRYFNHGKNFWREVERVLPDWRYLRKELRKEEDCLDYLR